MKLKIFVTFDGIVMIVSLVLMYILNYIDIHDKRIYAGLSSTGFWRIPFLITFLISLVILVFITIKQDGEQRSNHPEHSWKVSIRNKNIIYMIYLVIMIIY